jgi:hypothetical protein
MSRKPPMAATLLVAGLAYSAPLLAFAQSPTAIDTAMIEQITGIKGTFAAEENVFKVSRPGAEVNIVVDGWTMPPFMGSPRGLPSRRAATGRSC